MPASPLTPHKDGSDKLMPSPSATKTSSDKSSSISKPKMTEPSPASTYGETVGSSMPATPFEPSGHDVSAGIVQSMRAVQLDSAIKSISGSPMAEHETKHCPPIKQQAGHVSLGGPQASPSKTVEGSVKQDTSTDSSPANRAQAIRSAPTWRGGQQNEFAKTIHDHPDDPFVSSSKVERLAETTLSTSIVCHPDKVGVTPTNTTAQAIYSPQACVFVANLTQSESDEQLEYAVTEAFQRFGNVYVKIRRDARQMPFAFAQYTNVEDAQRAITLGRGMLINGRPCRTEVARVNRSLYLSKINGGTITDSEAREIMGGYGPIELVWFATQTEREMFGLPEGIFIRFAFFDDCRDALVSFRDSATHRLEQVKGLEESRSTVADRVNRSVPSPYARGNAGRVISPSFTRRHVDARSVFVGNLPPHLSEDQLTAMFQMYGRIMHVEIIRKPSMVNASGVNAFAFIEYEHAQSATFAVQAGSQAYQGLHLRVEYKEPYNSPSRATSNFTGSPRRPGMLDSQDVLVAFQRGVSMGMNQAAQAQLLPPPIYPQYPYYASYNGSMSQASMPPTSQDPAAANAHTFSAGYATPIAGQYSFSGGSPTNFEQYQQQPHHYYHPHGAVAHVQYPSASGYEDIATANPTILHETR